MFFFSQRVTQVTQTMAMIATKIPNSAPEIIKLGDDRQVIWERFIQDEFKTTNWQYKNNITNLSQQNWYCGVQAINDTGSSMCVCGVCVCVSLTTNCHKSYEVVKYTTWPRLVIVLLLSVATFITPPYLKLRWPNKLLSLCRKIQSHEDLNKEVKRWRCS